MVKMKRKEKIAIALFSSLILLSFVNISTAAPGSYIGVATGDEYVWVPTVNMANVNTTGIALFGLENWTFAYNMLLELYKNSTGMDFSSFAGAGLKVVVKNVSDEVEVGPGVFGTALNFDLYTSSGNNNWTMMINNTIMGIYDPNSLNESTIMYAFGGIPLIMAKGTNYTMATNFFNTMITADPYLNGNVTVETQGNGFKITLLSNYLEALFNSSGAPFDIGTLSDVIFNVRWNLNGVFEYGEVVYGGLTIASIQLAPGDGLIPGFEIATIIGVSIVTIFAVIYIKRKKNN